MPNLREPPQGILEILGSRERDRWTDNLKKRCLWLRLSLGWRHKNTIINSCDTWLFLINIADGHILKFYHVEDKSWGSWISGQGEGQENQKGWQAWDVYLIIYHNHLYHINHSLHISYNRLVCFFPDSITDKIDLCCIENQYVFPRPKSEPTTKVGLL